MATIHEIRTHRVVNDGLGAVEADTGAVTAALVVNYIVGIVEVLLGLRFLLRLFGANPSASFTDFIYNITNPLMVPFQAILPATSEAGAVFDWSILFAMIAYALIGWAVIRLIEIASGDRI